MTQTPYKPISHATAQGQQNQPAIPPDGPEISDLLCFAIYSANHALTRLYRPLLAPLGLTYPQYLVLISLRHNPGQTIKALGQQLDLETHTLTPLLKRMEEAELLRRVPNPQDDRSRLLELTEKGAERAAKAGEITACIVEGMGGDLEELLDLRDRVNALRSRMGVS